MADYSHGVLTTTDKSVGFLQSLKFGIDGKNLLIANELGVTKVNELFDDKASASIEMKFDRDQTMVERGDIVTLSNTPSTNWDGKYLVETVAVDEQNEDNPNVTIEATQYIDGDVPTQA